MSAPGRTWAYFGALLGGAVSIWANVEHSYVPPDAIVKAGAAAVEAWQPHPGAVILSAFWPVALFVVVEIFARVDWPDRHRWVALRFLGLLPVASVAAIVSYRHLSGLLGWFGEDSVTQVIGPLAVDGLMVMASGALVAIGRRSARPVRGAASTADAAVPVEGPREGTEPAVDDLLDPGQATVDDPADPGQASTDPLVAAPAAAVAFEQVNPDSDPGQTVTGNAEIVRRIHTARPDASHAELARLTGLSASTVKRHRPVMTRVNGHQLSGVAQ
jgi:hypothetical protein